MATDAQATQGALQQRTSNWKDLVQKEDWWAVWLGLGLTLAAVWLFLNGSSIKWLAVIPKKWDHVADAAADLRTNAARYLTLFGLWAVLFGIGARALGWKVSQFLISFVLVFVVSVLIFTLGQWSQADHYNLEPPLVALLLGLLISNLNLLPRWMDAGFRVEYFVKTGIVLLGATLPFTLIVWAGPVAILQASIVSLVTFGVIYFVGVKLGLDKRLAATLGAGGAICGVSGAIAISGAVGGRKQDAPVAITLVIFWAIIMIFVLPIVARALHLPTGVAGAWIGTSEFADAAGLAAAQAYGGYADGHVAGISGSPDAALNSFTLMKVIGRDVWIGIWAFILSIVATTRWESTGVNRKPDAGEIWRRFPKFVIGFLLASLIITAVTGSISYADFKKATTADLVAPIKNLRTWAFIFCFLSIGLTTRLRELSSAGLKPFYAFSAGVVVNVVLGFVLSAVVFFAYWSGL
ncbi:MAG TPA: putative sulfate exporter family transporter [Steroidobacteraceae bacterium]|jgi:uncharacterized integral membrane protein (TIGR00698 family)